MAPTEVGPMIVIESNRVHLECFEVFGNYPIQLDRWLMYII